jgi:hypothetical protein
VFRRLINSAVLVALSACGGGEAPATAEADPLAAYSAAGRAAPSSTRILSGVNMWAYCNSLDYPAVGYRRGYIEGAQGADSNWVCQRGTIQLAPVDFVLVDMDAACRWQNGRTDVVARPDDPNHAWTWNCYVDLTAAGARRDSTR